MRTHFRFLDDQGRVFVSSFSVASRTSASLVEIRMRPIPWTGVPSSLGQVEQRGRSVPPLRLRFRLSRRGGLAVGAPGEAGRRSSLFYEVSGQCQTQLR